jgi:hypothetical protein
VTAVRFSEAPSLQDFVLGPSSNFIDSESGPIQRVKVLQYGRRRNPTPPFQPPTHCIFLRIPLESQGGLC